MSFENVSMIYVSFMKGLEQISVGRLMFQQRKFFFEYDLDFIKTGFELSPFKLPLQVGVQENKEMLFEGLFGVFNDSLPDGWGRLLLDRKLMQLGINPGQLTPLDRLRYVGKGGMGALMYTPEITDVEHYAHENLDKIAIEIQTFQEDDDRFIDHLLSLNGSSAGTRPKSMIKIEEEDWMIKFRSSIDPKDTGSIEYAYHLMAQHAGLEVPQAKLFPSQRGLGYFGVKRFDRQHHKRIHMHTLSGLLHADHRLPSLDYKTILKTTAWLTKDIKECQKQFRASVFNVLSHNRDDHAKNFSFLMDEEGRWHVSPAYDLTFSSGPAGEHCSMIMGEGKNPQLKSLLKLASIVDIKQQEAIQIIDEVKTAVSQWQNFAKEAGVTKTSSNMIQTMFNQVAREGLF